MLFRSIQQADAVCAAQLVQVLHQLHSAHLLAVHGSGNALFKVDGHIGRGVGSLLGADTQLQETGVVVLGLVGGALQIQTLVAQMPQVLVLGVVGLAVDLQGDVVSLGVVDLLVTALDVRSCAVREATTRRKKRQRAFRWAIFVWTVKADVYLLQVKRLI